MTYVKKVLPNSNGCGNNDATTKEPTNTSLLSIEDGNPAVSNVSCETTCLFGCSGRWCMCLPDLKSVVAEQLVVSCGPLVIGSSSQEVTINECVIPLNKSFTDCIQQRTQVTSHIQTL